MKRNLWIILTLEYISVFLIGMLIVILGNHSVNVSIENAPLIDRSCVIVDAGHGGVDGGATSCTGILESDINLQIALRLNDLLKLLGINTVMIRNSDQSVYTEGETIAAKKYSDLKQRVKIVNSREDALLVSIHQNYFSDSRYYGAQVFYSKTPGSDLLANTMQDYFAAVIDKSNHRKAKQANGIYLMQHIKGTGVLVECGFLSNPDEEKRLRDPYYQLDLCSVIACACSNYLHSRMA